MNPEDLTKDKVNQETSKIAWSELQRFFAQGLAVNVTPDLDLVEVAYISAVTHWLFCVCAPIVRVYGNMK
jgi:hypothetical protein